MDTAAYGLLAHPDQWARCRHEDTALVATGGVQLSWQDAVLPARPVGLVSRSLPPGLAFDRWGCAYRSWPDAGRVSVQPPATGMVPEANLHLAGTFPRPSALAIDNAQRLYVVQEAGARIAVADLWAQQMLRRIPVANSSHRWRRAVDLAARCCEVLVLVRRPEAILVAAGRRGPLPGPDLVRPRCRGAVRASRIAVAPDGMILVLWQRGDNLAPLIATSTGTTVVEVPGAADLTVRADGSLAVACEPGLPVRRFAAVDGSLVESGTLELDPLAQPRFDAGSIGESSGRLCCTCTDGIAWTGGPAVRFLAAGRVITYRLDSGTYHTRWGRVFLDACLPPGTGVTMRCLTSDEDTVPDAVAPQPAARGGITVHRPDLTPPLPSAAALAQLEPQPAAPLFRRPAGREQPWTQIPASDRFETYEAPVGAAPGRYLWLVLDLTSTTGLTPRIREMRVERPGHRLLAHLPRAWSRDDGDADFLHRFLAPLDGLLRELDGRAVQRSQLIDPAATPQEALTWLAGFAGLALDRRWPEAARRELIAQVYPLFARRGTLGALTQLLAIYLGYPPVIVERWRLRGIPGATLGAGPGSPAPAQVGVAIRTGGSLGGVTVGGAAAGSAGGTSAPADGYATAAHRFSVLIPAELTREQRDVVENILDAHRPAHTQFEICELGLGMRVGQHLHIALTSVVGAGAAWAPAVIGRAGVGVDGVVGVPSAGSRLDSDRVGAFRVG